jgi:TrmH family RNA methyltransferase
MITSAQNPRIQWVRKLQAQAKARRSENAFVVEGVRLCEEALASGWPAHLVLHTEDLSERGQRVAAGLATLGAALELVSWG